MDLRALLPAFGQHLAARGAAIRTLTTYASTAGAFLAEVGDHGVVRADVEAYLARSRRDGRPRAASTKRAELLALRAFFRFASREGAVVDPTDGIEVKRERRAAPQVAMPADVTPLFEAAARSSNPRRNTAILGLAFVLGLRVHELVGLDVQQIDLVAAVLRRVRGKGGTVVDFPLPSAVAALLAEWQRERVMLGHGAEGPLFPTARPASSQSGRLSIRSVQRLVARLAEGAGLGRRIGPHALRHGCATAAISLGIDVPTAAEVMRHASLVTTQGYVHLARDARREALERIASLIPRSVLPADVQTSRNPTGNGASEGVATPVDNHPAMDDILQRSDHAPSPPGTSPIPPHPAPLPPGAGFVPGGGGPRVVRAGRDVDASFEGSVGRCPCCGCTCARRLRRQRRWRERRRAVVDGRSD